MPAIKLVSIIGAGHSGSTLLDILLGGHADICSVGEISHWDQYLSEKQICSCGYPPHECVFWQQIVKSWYDYLEQIKPVVSTTDTRSNTVVGFSNRIRYRGSLLFTLLLPMYRQPQFLDTLLPEYTQRANNILELYSHIRDFSGKSIVCDSSKAVYRFRLLHAHRPEQCKAIFLTRDGRAVASSHFKREGEPVEVNARRWKFTNKYTMHMLRTLPDHTYIHIRYEELCREPKLTLQKICDFLGCTYDPAMLQFANPGITT